MQSEPSESGRMHKRKQKRAAGICAGRGKIEKMRKTVAYNGKLMYNKSVQNPTQKMNFYAIMQEELKNGRQAD